MGKTLIRTFLPVIFQFPKPKTIHCFQDVPSPTSSLAEVHGEKSRAEDKAEEVGSIAKARRKLGGDGHFWVNYNDLTTASLEIMVSKGNHPQMALIQISELL